ncbi:MAG: ATP-dependent helicase [Saccharofermentanales bacterium]
MNSNPIDSDYFSIGGFDNSADQSAELVKGLNPEQKEAVLHDRGPLLILAGAGSGKTRVITQRIAYLVKYRGVSPYRILAITFTNKAAKEMKNRIESLIGSDVESLWVGTFHSMMVRILRKHIDLLGFDKHFIILDSDDQQRVIKSCLEELGLDEKKYPARMVQSIISNAKNALTDATEFAQGAAKEYREREIAKVYKLYQDKLKAASALDFDDILFFAVEVFRTYPDILEYYRGKFEYILVDEYQDTNHAQYQIIELLAKKHRNLCVVGDDDQSIYSFRGANIRNILDFEQTFKGCRVIKLEQNYRSTKTVLDAANSVIANNKGRKAKKLWTNADQGEPITVLRADDQISEARYVAGEISRLVKQAATCSYGEIAILYRLNALSRNFETELLAAKIPFKILGGMRFFERREIKDLLAYMRIILVGDNLSFLRIINVPRRGIGDVTLGAVSAAAERLGISYLEAAEKSREIPELSKAWPKLTAFYELIRKLRDTLEEDKKTLPEYFEYVQEESGIVQEIIEQREKKDEVTDRVENLRELLSAVIEFDSQMKTVREWQLAHGSGEASLYEDTDFAAATIKEKLAGYIESVTLYTDAEVQVEGEEFVRLMTIHSAKGLEFDYVFLVGAEEGLFPGVRTLNEGGGEGLEEERRLAYVSITRARKKLIVTTARNRMLFGQTQCNPVSRFIREIPDQFVEEISQGRTDTQSAFGNTRGVGTYQSTLSKGFREPDAILSTLVKKDSSASRPADAGDFLKPADVKTGDKVMHIKFGNGRILAIIPVADDAIVEIGFDEFGTKKLMLKQARLTRN